MAFREVSVFEVREVLRLWLAGKGFRELARLGPVDRKAARRYVEAAIAAGLDPAGGDDQLTDALVAAVVLTVRPVRPAGRGSAWESLLAVEDRIQGWIDKDLTSLKISELLAREGIVVPYRTLCRFTAERCGRGQRRSTVPVVDGEPGGELQVDFGRLGLLFDPETGRRRLAWALVFTAGFSRHLFVWVSFTQTTKAVIAGCEAAWRFFGGVFRVLVPDNMKAIVERASPTEPKITVAFLEYAQSRGFVIDPARVRSPQDKGRVERAVLFVRQSFWAGEEFVDLADAQARAEVWCRDRAGMRIHGTTGLRPVELFTVEEAPRLLPAPMERYDLPTYPNPKVHPDHHIEVERALYSVPGNLVGQRVSVRADSKLVKIFLRGQLIKTHLRAEGRWRTDPADLPDHKMPYATRDLETLKRMSAKHGPAVGRYAELILDTPLPWTRMRQVYALNGLARRYGPARVDEACAKALEVEVVNVGLITRMLERATEAAGTPHQLAGTVVPGRFARDDSHFAVTGAEEPPAAAAAPLPGFEPAEASQ